LKDLENKIADAFGATRTPQVFVLDQDRVIRYQGRIDDQYGFGSGVGYAQPKLRSRDLGNAIDELLAGKEVSVALTEAKGCIIGRVRTANDDSPVTYSNQVARVLQDRCVECHREGQIAPFTMTSYDEVAGWGEMIAEVVQERRMPPWFADPKHGTFSNENSLTADEKELIVTWVKNGCPEGDPADLPEPREFVETWQLPREPDMVIHMTDEPVEVKAEGVEPYHHYAVDPGFTEDKWVQFAESLPGNRSVVHHIIVFVVPPDQEIPKELTETGEEKKLSLRERRRRRREARAGRDNLEDQGIAGYGLLSGYAPGTPPMRCAPGMAKRVPAGSKFIFQMHYTPNGSVQTDRSSVGLIFVPEEEVTHQLVTTYTANFDFEIPPNTANHLVEAKQTLQRDATMIGLFPHMHLRGKSMKYDVTYPDGKTETLLDVPNYDFNWQLWYSLAEPKVLPKGTEMHVTAYFDNSSDNLANPDPDSTITFGEQTWEEMMIGWYDVAFPVDKVKEYLEEQEKSQRAAADSKSDNGEGSE
jgi:hypothetical protein